MNSSSPWTWTRAAAGAPEFSLDESVIGPRMDSTPWSLTYMRHQRDGTFWRAPLRPIDELAIPAFLIGGLQDGYRDSIPRMLEQVEGAPQGMDRAVESRLPQRQRLRAAV